jgi:hypothetical protein
MKSRKIKINFQNEVGFGVNKSDEGDLSVTFSMFLLRLSFRGVLTDIFPLIPHVFVR